MQFRKQQRKQAADSWGSDSWFYQHSGQPIRDIVGRAYGLYLYPCTPKERTKSQEYLTLALSIFARKIGAEKSHVVHALLTNSVPSLMAAIRRIPGANFSSSSLATDWEASFREVSFTP